MQKYMFQDRVQDSVFRLSGYSFSDWHLKLPIYAYAKNAFIVAAMSCLMHCMSAQAQTDASSATKNTGVLSESVRLALFNHPEISEANVNLPNRQFDQRTQLVCR